MTWREWHAARQYLSEVRLGVLLRQKAHEEDEAFRRSAAKLSR